MSLEKLSKADLVIKEALLQSSTEKSDKYLEKNKRAMDVKMYLALEQLHSNKNRKNYLN